MKEILTSPKFIAITLAVIALIVIPITLIQVQSEQNTQQNAETILWETTHRQVLNAQQMAVVQQFLCHLPTLNHPVLQQL